MRIEKNLQTQSIWQVNTFTSCRSFIIIRFCKSYGFSRPRMYRRQARKNYLALAKAKKRSTKKIRATIRKQLAYIKRDIDYLESYMEEGYAVNDFLSCHQTALVE